MLAITSIMALAQRFTDNLDRGLVAVNTGSSVFLSWRVQADEYHGVTYNVYRNGTKIKEGLTVSNYTDGTVGSSYAVSAVVNGVEQSPCAAVTTWGNGSGAGLLDITLAAVYDRNGADVSANYEPNDAEFADLDGDGQLEMIIKRLNTVDAANVYPQSNTTEFVVLDAYDINWKTGAATLMWRIDCGPNMVSLNSTEINIIAYDWDEDGIAEVVLRGADNMIVYGNTGKNRLYTIGDMSVNTRDTFDPANGAQYAWTHTGAEYLIYMNGQTGAKYQVTEYPLKRLEYASTLSAEWGGRGYGHNSSKYFFGAPFLDGRKASLFMARGIYGTHKMIAMDLNSKTHQWSQRWRWNCKDTNSPWYGQGYHNFVVADVDEDGRDEIVYGSMVIDDNGKGLYTTGLGHGDAQHVSDFDPWRKGLEFFGCLEESTGFNYRNATTGEIYFRATSDDDDGRCIAANFMNNYPGSIGRSSSHGMISCVTDQDLTEISNLIAWSDCNFRIYWDGDLCSEVLNSTGTAKEAKVEKPGVGRSFTSSGCNMNNDTKNNPCFQGDLLGDWREEIVVRCGSNVRVYTSTTSTAYALPSLWYDHQYRQAMVWQMMAYNQPPHLSYFLGESEGYTQAPPSLTTRNRTELSAGASFGTEMDGKHLLFCPQSNATLTFTGQVSPTSLTINTPTWVQGNDNNNNITTTTYTHTLSYSGSGSSLQGDMYFVKQGDGILNMPKKTLTYTGPTEIWGGTVNFDGTLTASPVSMKRFTTLNSTGGSFNGGMTMEYGATLNVGGATAQTLSTVTISDLTLNYGARIVLDLNSTDASQNDQLNLTTLTINPRDWENGPKYSAPVFQFNCRSSLADGVYPIGTLSSYEGELSRVVIEGVVPANSDSKYFLDLVDGKLCLVVGGTPTLNPPTIEFMALAPCGDLSDLYPTAAGVQCYLPVVSITNNKTNTSTGTYTPTLSATFTDTEGNTTYVGSTEPQTLYSQNYENATDVADWESGCNKYLNTGDATYGNYVNIASENSGGDRRAYKRFFVTGNDFYGTSTSYIIEFDALFHRTNTTNLNELVLFGEGAAMPVVNANFASASNNYLFRLTGGNNNTTYSVEGSDATASLGDAWCHYVVEVNKTTRTVTYTVKNGSSTVFSGSYIANADANMNIQGIGITLGRAWSYAYIDNIKITTAVADLESFAFSRPGTLTVTASLNGFESKSASYMVDKPYKILKETPAYNEIQAADAAAVLGSNFSSASFTSRFAYWSKTNATYGDSYVMVASGLREGILDDAGVLSFSNNGREYRLIQDFGIGRDNIDVNTIITASNLGDANTIVYYKADLSRGGATNYDEGYIHANDDGTWTYSLYQNCTFCKFIAYVPLSYLRGDLNHDGFVNIVDVTILTNYILGKDLTTTNTREADLNNDENVDVNDIVVLTNIILKKE